MKLHQALTIAKRFLDVKAGFDGVRLTHGTVEAGTDAHGVRILVPDLVLGSREITVNAAMLAPVAREVKAGTHGVRRTTLTLTRKDGQEFTLPGLSLSKQPARPEPPTDWHDLTEGESAVLVAVAALGNKPTADDLTGWVRWTPAWVASTRGSVLTVGWVLGAVAEPVTFPTNILKALTGEVSVSLDSMRRIWVRAGDQSRWAQLETRPWADDSSVDAKVAEVRSAAGRTYATLPLGQLADLAARAALAGDNAAEPARLTLGDGKLSMVMTGRSSFKGDLEATIGGEGSAEVGIEPKVLAEVAKVIAKATSAEAQTVSAGGGTAWVAVVGYHPTAIESMVAPAYLPE